MRGGPNKQKGVLSIFTAAAIMVVLGMVGLAIDTGRMLSTRTEMQSAVDACSLAGALELNGLPDATTRAAYAGRYVAGRDKQAFQKTAVNIPNSGVTFSATLSGTYVNADGIAGSLARYIKCETLLPGVVTYFLRVLGVNSADLKASAIATVAPSQSVCALPMAIFEGNNNGSNPSNFDYQPGEVIPITGANTGRGFFTWADVLNATTVSGLTPYSNALIGYGSCGATTAPGRCIGIKTGEVASLVEEWNTRFGLYKSYTPTTAVPDLSGYGYNPDSYSVDTTVLPDFLNIRVPARTAYQRSIPSYIIPLNVNQQYGAPYRRITAVPVIRDDAACGNASKRLVGWACILMLKPVSTSNADPAKVMFISNAASTGSPCRASGVAGGAGAVGPLVPVIVQ